MSSQTHEKLTIKEKIKKAGKKVMKTITNHLASVLLAICAVIVCIAVISFTAPSISGMFNNVLDEEKSIAEDMLDSIITPAAEDPEDNNAGGGGGSTASNLMISGPEFQTAIDAIKYDIEAVEVVTTIPDISSYTSFDVSAAQDGGVMAWQDGTTLYIGSTGKPVANPDCNNMFYGFSYAGTYNLGNLDTSRVTDMNHMFYWAGSAADEIALVGLESWNVSNVTDMSYMFNAADGNTQTITHKFTADLSGWDTSNVTTMSHMFHGAGMSATENDFNIGDISGWDLTSVTDTSYMFYSTTHVGTFYVGDIEKWDTSNIQNMDYMFYGAGSDGRNPASLDLSGWDVSNVTTHKLFVMFGGWQSYITVPVWN